jgi:hypothetical protein
MTDPEVPPLGSEIDGPGRRYFDDVVIDNLLDAFLELSAELWTVRDRADVLEAVLATKGIEVAAAIEAHRPDAAELARRRAAREAFVARIGAPFLRRTDRESKS